jgi:hypothetical protein
MQAQGCHVTERRHFLNERRKNLYVRHIVVREVSYFVVIFKGNQ